MAYFPGMSSFGLFVLLYIQFSLYIGRCAAQTPHDFIWGFADTSQLISTQIQQCKNLQINVSPLNSSVTSMGTPPYYLTAFQPGGFSTISFVGTDPKNLTWQVNHPAGSQLLLGMADANKSSGGTSAAIYTVTAGDASCLPQTPTTGLSLIANVTTTLKSCDYWGLHVQGGVAPYNITIAAVNSPVVTNVSLDAGYDVFTWPNRADPNGQVLATVSDATGQFGNTTVLVNTTGSTDVTCRGRAARQGKSSDIPLYWSQPSSSSKKTVIIGAVVGTIGGVIVLAIIVLLVLFLRRRWYFRRFRGGHDTLPRIFRGPQQEIDSPSSMGQTFQSEQLYSSSNSKSAMSQLRPEYYSGVSTSSGPSSATTSHPPGIVPYVPKTGVRSSHTSSGSVSSQDRPLPPVPPTSSQDFDVYPVSASGSRRVAKGQDGRLRTSGSAGELGGGNRNSAGGGRNHPPSSRRPLTADGTPQPDIIIQHRDGGVVQELPPPYLDRTRPTIQENDAEGSS